MDSFFYFFFALDGRPEGRAKRSIIQFGHCARFGSKWKSKLNDERWNGRALCEWRPLPTPFVVFERYRLDLFVVDKTAFGRLPTIDEKCCANSSPEERSPLTHTFLCVLPAAESLATGWRRALRHSSLEAQLTIRTDVSQTHNRIRIVNGIM